MITLTPILIPTLPSRPFAVEVVTTTTTDYINRIIALMHDEAIADSGQAHAVRFEQANPIHRRPDRPLVRIQTYVRPRDPILAITWHNVDGEVRRYVASEKTLPETIEGIVREAHAAIPIYRPVATEAKPSIVQIGKTYALFG